ASESALPGTAPPEALHTFTLDSSASRCFFRDNTTLTPLPAPVPVRLADPSGGTALARSTTVLPCAAVPSGSLSSLHLPSFSTNLVSITTLQDAMVTTTTTGGRRVAICRCTQTGRHLATFTRRHGSSHYTLSTKPSQVAASGQGSTAGQVATPYSCRLLSLPPLPPSPALPCLPCIKGRQRAAPHSSSFPPTTDPLQTLHMDMWGPARVSGQGRERYLLLVVDDYTCYTTASLQKNGVAERHIGFVMEPNLSLSETSPTLRWTGKVGNVSVFWVWGFRVFVRDTSADKLSSRAIPCVFLGFPPDAPGWKFYHPTSHRVLPSQDITFDESVPFYRLFPYRTAPLPPPPPLFLAPGPPPVDPLPPQGPAPSGVSQVDPLPLVEPVEVTIGYGAAGGAASWGAEPVGAEPRGAEPASAEPASAEPGGAEPEGAKPGGAETEGAELGDAESEGAESEGAEPRGTASAGGPAGASPQQSRQLEPLSPRRLRVWFAWRTRLRSGTPGAGGLAAGGTGAGGAGVTAGAGGTRGAGTRDPGAGGAGAGGAGDGGTGAGGIVQRRPSCCHSYYHTDPSFEYAAASVLVAELVDFAVACRLDYAASLVVESESDCPPSVGGECTLGTDVLEDKQEDFECLPAIVPHLVAMLLAPEGNLDAPDIPTPCSYAEAITVPAPGANIVDSMWIFRVKRPPGSLSVFKARYLARGFSQRQGVDFFHTFSRTPNMSTLPGSLHEEIWLRRPPGFTRSFPAGTQWSLRRPVYGLRQAPREWHDTLRTTLAALGFAPSTADPSLFLRTDTSMTPFHIPVYVDNLVFATADIEALALVNSGLQKRHTCTDLAPLALRLPVLLATVHSSAYWSLALSSTFRRFLHRAWGSCFEDGVQMSSLDTQTRLGSSCEAEIYAGAMAAQDLRWLTYLLTDLGEWPRSPPVLYVDNKAMIALCQEHRLEHRTKHIALRYFLTPELQQRGQLRLVYVATRANTVVILTKALQSGDHQRFCTVLGIVPNLPHLLTT
ncbi:unnamed protein product, partial [Closterium sp. NIES-53]